MAKTPLFLLCILTLLASNSIQSYAQQHEFFFAGFNEDTTNITLNGGAVIEHKGTLRLTNDTERVIGHAFYSTPINFKNKNNSTNHKVFSFSTSFAFAIIPQYPKLGGHGFAFTVSPSNKLSNGYPSQYLGLLNPKDLGNFSNHLFAVEFDTVQDFEFNDINDNHVGINLNNMVSNKSVKACFFTDGSTSKQVQDLNLKSGSVIQAWIDYDSSINQLEVRLSPSSSKPTSPILSYQVDLTPIFKETMYVGFSSSTGLLSSSHYILGWSFKINGESKTLSLKKLPSLSSHSNKTTQTRKAIILGLSISFVILVVLTTGLSVYFKMKNYDVIEAWELEVGPHRFPYKELNQATGGFKDKNLIGFGGFGRVYKGVLVLPNSKTEIAVKQISHESKQGLQEFISEIETIGKLRHRNLVELLGWCRKQNDLILVYDFMKNGSLDKYIFEQPRAMLKWEERFRIIKGVAFGLVYLHEECEQTVIHRDVKAGNVLLDCEMNARLGDFGLAKLYDRGENPNTTRVVGTLGYLAPELTRTGKPTTSSDVFAFGALLLEVVCGRRPIEVKALPEELVLVDWVWDRWRLGAVKEVVDCKMGGVYDEVEVLLVVKVGLMCSDESPERRPTMRQVVRYLEREVKLPELDGFGVKKKDFLYSTGSGFGSGNTWSSVGDDVDGGYVSSFTLSGGR
ncbi:unnamed protein product [Lathyrus oleraceus]|uniref:non-specific serine/threonine protein kinase n=1 Tax=Pisum sativum TaxID=3888 RepID=A0A9D5AGF3_PEA|nr:L-type lectin-domain containing receptor kinase S.4-like [Pisum sativum]KAI5407408.1 hypothetical protein KIW84_053605 [Pisum sativum]